MGPACAVGNTQRSTDISLLGREGGGNSTPFSDPNSSLTPPETHPQCKVTGGAKGDKLPHRPHHPRAGSPRPAVRLSDSASSAQLSFPPATDPPPANSPAPSPALKQARDPRGEDTGAPVARQEQGPRAERPQPPPPVAAAGPGWQAGAPRRPAPPHTFPPSPCSPSAAP